MNATDQQYDTIMARCRALFKDKTLDYGTSWRVLRSPSLTDQLYIKALRIRTVEVADKAQVNESIEDGFIALVNYALMGIIQVSAGFADNADMDAETALQKYDKAAEETRELMQRKNHDYGEAWRTMRIGSFTDIILQKIMRTKTIENNGGKTIVSEGIKANYQDIVNYALFALIRLSEEKDVQEGEN